MNYLIRKIQTAYITTNKRHSKFILRVFIIVNRMGTQTYKINLRPRYSIFDGSWTDVNTRSSLTHDSYRPFLNEYTNDQKIIIMKAYYISFTLNTDLNSHADKHIYSIIFMSIVSTLVFKQILKRCFTLWHHFNTSNSFPSINLNMRVKRSTIVFSFRLKWLLVFYVYHLNRNNVREISDLFWRVSSLANVDISLASMIIELWGFFSVSHIFEHEHPFVMSYPGTLDIKPLTECLAKKKKGHNW